MADKYSEGASNSLTELFYQKEAYTQKSIQLSTGDSLTDPKNKNLINYNLTELGLYGKVNNYFIPIVVKENSLKRFSPKNTRNPARPAPQALSYVVDIFELMATQFDKCAQIGRIRPHEEFLSSLRVDRAYVSPRTRYNEYFSILSQVFKDQVRQEAIDILDFDDFMNVLIRFLKNGALTFPFTKTGFIKSRHSSMLSSGLVIEIADLDYNNDQVKIDKFINSPNWDFYVQTCNSYGFIIDTSAPWRLMADLDSIIMKEYASQYGLSGATLTLLRAYDTVSGPYFREQFINNLLDLYNNTKTTIVVKPSICDDDTTTLSSQKTTNYTITELRENYSLTYFLKKYLEIRFLEEESQYTTAKKEQIISNCLYLFNSQGSIISIASFEKIINKPFDYLGSMSYTNKQIQARFESDLPEPDVREQEREILRIKNKKR